MQLTQDERRMLDGEYGRACRKAMEILVDTGGDLRGGEDGSR